MRDYCAYKKFNKVMQLFLNERVTSIKKYNLQKLLPRLQNVESKIFD